MSDVTFSLLSFWLGILPTEVEKTTCDRNKEQHANPRDEKEEPIILSGER